MTDPDLVRISSNIRLFIHTRLRKYCEDANKRNEYDNVIEKNEEHITYIVNEIFTQLCDDDNLEFFDMDFDVEDIVNIDKYKVQYALTLDFWDYIGLPF
jgi:hypothetical protein